MPVLLTVVTDTPDNAQLEQLEKVYADAQTARLSQFNGAGSAKEFVQRILEVPDQELYCGLFKDRLIAAVVVEKTDDLWQVSSLCVRSVTRRRGVGCRLLTLVIEAAKADGKPVHIQAEALMTPDHIILQRMGFSLSESGKTYCHDFK